jgi:hypothetical protein
LFWNKTYFPLITTAFGPAAMFHDDLRATEKRWQRRRLFRKRQSHLTPRLVALTLILVAVAIVAW